MFGGNAKTHFQVLGRGDNPMGYMMSPFGDERWDIDDQEKMKKIRKGKDLSEPVQSELIIPAVRTMNQNQYHPPGGCRHIQCQGPNQQASETQLSGKYRYHDPYGVPSQVFSPKVYEPPRPATCQNQKTGGWRTECSNHRMSYAPQGKNGLQDENKNVYICDSCQSGSTYRQARSWRSSPDVPITITGETNYKPLGPTEATPSPFFPPKERNLYVPLN